MELNTLKKFAQAMRRSLISQIASRLSYVTSHDDAYLRAHDKEKRKIAELVKAKGEEQFLEEVAYVWFNRLTALRFMDNRGYNRIKIVSSAEGESQPQVLSELKQGRIPEGIEPVKDEIYGYLNGRVKADQPDREAYKAALLCFCNHLGSVMPYMFEEVHDWAALLLPADLLSEDSVISQIRKNVSAEDCKDVEVIGWLYQFYISEKKDRVFADLKKNVKIAPENIPAATQLFTPHWIVRYMTENSLGRLWLNNRPGSKLKKKMEYYVESDEEREFLQIQSPEDIKVMDPACGSGHILAYAFDLLFSMYEEEGYSPSDIPNCVLTKNLYGIDIDDRAASMASFCLAMKARERDRLFFTRNIRPMIIASSNVTVNLKTAGIRLSPNVQESFEYLKQAKNLGSLIPVPPDAGEEIQELTERLTKEIKAEADLFAQEAKEQVLNGLVQLDFLLPRYHSVVTNPPYMGGKGMNESLKSYVGKCFPDSKSDLFAVFMERGLALLKKNGFLGMITMQSWMFLSSFEKLRVKLLKNTEIITRAHLGPRAFETIGGEVVQTTSFILRNGSVK